jgi:hypothetical protein
MGFGDGIFRRSKKRATDQSAQNAPAATFRKKWPGAEKFEKICAFENGRNEQNAKNEKVVKSAKNAKNTFFAKMSKSVTTQAKHGDAPQRSGGPTHANRSLEDR